MSLTAENKNILFKIRCLKKEGVVVHEFDQQLSNVKEIFETLEKQVDTIIDVKEKDKSVYVININISTTLNGVEYKLSDFNFIRDESIGGFVQIEAMMLNGLSVMLNMTKEQLTAARMGLTKSNATPAANNTTPSGIIL